MQNGLTYQTQESTTSIMAIATRIGIQEVMRVDRRVGTQESIGASSWCAIIVARAVTAKVAKAFAT